MQLIYLLPEVFCFALFFCLSICLQGIKIACEISVNIRVYDFPLQDVFLDHFTCLNFAFVNVLKMCSNEYPTIIRTKVP